MRRLEASLRRATPKGHETFISRTAPHQGPVLHRPLLAFRTHSGTHKVGGYSILQGESLEEISQLLDGHPHFHSPDASIEVREFLSMPGMS